MVFKDRQSAGAQLATYLEKYKTSENTVVIGVAKGGVVVAYEIAKALQLPLDFRVIRKIAAPGNEKLAIGAVGENGEAIFNENLLSILSVSPDYLKREVENGKRLVKEHLALYREKFPKLELKGKIVILVDEGMATGATMKAALQELKLEAPKKILVAVPVSGSDSLKKMESEAEEVICLSKPSYFESIDAFYRSFNAIPDREVLQLLEKSLSRLEGIV